MVGHPERGTRSGDCVDTRFKSVELLRRRHGARSGGGNRNSWHREERKAVRGGPASADGAGEDAGKVAVKPTLGDKFFHGAREPVAAVAIAEALFEERFKHTGSAVRVVPD